MPQNVLFWSYIWGINVNVQTVFLASKGKPEIVISILVALASIVRRIVDTAPSRVFHWVLIN